MRAIALTMTMLLLAACSTDPHLMSVTSDSNGPDEFGIEIGRASCRERVSSPV